MTEFCKTTLFWIIPIPCQYYKFSLISTNSDYINFFFRLPIILKYIYVGCGFEHSFYWTKGLKPNWPNTMNFQRMGLRTRCQFEPPSLNTVRCGLTNKEMGSSKKCCPRAFRPRSLVFFFFYFQYQVTVVYKTMQTAAVFSFFSLPALFPRSPILGGSLILYTSFQSILTLYLLIV